MPVMAWNQLARTNDGSTSCATQSFGATYSSLQRETHSGELGCYFPGCSENICAVDVPTGEVSESYHRKLGVTRDEAANMVAAGKVRDD